MKWKISGANRESGQQVEIIVEALTREDAVKKAGLTGMVISSVVQIAEPVIRAGRRAEARAFSADDARSADHAGEAAASLGNEVQYRPCVGHHWAAAFVLRRWHSAACRRGRADGAGRLTWGATNRTVDFFHPGYA